MNRVKKILAVVLIFGFLAAPISSYSQCAMCKAAAEAGMKEEGQEKIGAGLNKGILYLMSIPYLMGAVIGVAVYRNRKKISEF